MPGWGRGDSTRLPGGRKRYPGNAKGAAALRLCRCRTGDSRVFSRKPQDICEYVERSDRRVRGWAAGISGEAATAVGLTNRDFTDRSRAGQMPKASGSFAPDGSSGCLHPHDQRAGLFQLRYRLRPLDRRFRVLSRPIDIRTKQPVVLFWRRVHRSGEPESWRYRAGRICRRVGLPVDTGRCIPPQP